MRAGSPVVHDRSTAQAVATGLVGGHEDGRGAVVDAGEVDEQARRRGDAEGVGAGPGADGGGDRTQGRRLGREVAQPVAGVDGGQARARRRGRAEA